MSRHWRPLVSSARRSLPARSHCSDLARGLAAAADAEARLGVDEHRQDRAVRAAPELARLDGLARDRAAAPLGADLRAALPGAVARP